LAAALVALIGVSLAWSNVGGKSPISPGPLSRSHAQLLTSAKRNIQGDSAIDSENRCAACHSGLDGSQSAEIAIKQSDLCLKCHLQAMPDAVHGSPHDLHGKSLEELVASTDRTKSVAYTPTECSQCHREHQGPSHNLSEMTSQRCQACHQTRYQSFSTDHPEFKNYPYRRPENIEFNHAKHQDIYFAKKGASFDCKTCHIQSDQVGVVGQVFRSVPFEQACASCHTEPIKSAIQDGLIVLQIPSINRKELLGSGSDIGNWPEQASQLTDGIIPPIMRMLIESEPGGEALLSELPATGRLVELDVSNEQSRATLVKLSSMTKQLLRKLGNEGQPGFRSSVEKLVSTSEGPWLDQLANGVPPDLFRAAWYEWFEERKTVPRLSGSEKPPASVRLSSALRPSDDDLLSGSESLLNPKVQDPLNGDPASLLNSQIDSQSKEESPSSGFKDSRSFDQLAYGGWMIDRQRMAIVYVPTGHADQWLSKWIELEEMRTSSTQPKIGMATQCRQCHCLNSRLSSPTAPLPTAPLPTAKWNVAFRQANEVALKLATVSFADLNACWKSSRRAANLRPITKFDHTPHLTLPSISDCRSCHQLTAASSQFAHEEFMPMQKSQCSSCHQANAAGDSCTQCHNYHVGVKGWLDGK